MLQEVCPLVFLMVDGILMVVFLQLLHSMPKVGARVVLTNGKPT